MSRQTSLFLAAVSIEKTGRVRMRHSFSHGKYGASLYFYHAICRRVFEAFRGYLLGGRFAYELVCCEAFFFCFVLFFVCRGERGGVDRTSAGRIQVRADARPKAQLTSIAERMLIGFLRQEWSLFLSDKSDIVTHPSSRDRLGKLTPKL